VGKGGCAAYKKYHQERGHQEFNFHQRTSRFTYKNMGEIILTHILYLSILLVLPFDFLLQLCYIFTLIKKIQGGLKRWQDHVLFAIKSRFRQTTYRTQGTGPKQGTNPIYSL
jgi:hypothetical protein